MLWTLFLGLVAALLRTAAAANDVYRDPDTGLTFTANVAYITADRQYITYRVAIPEGVQSYTAYDLVIQMVMPNEVAWSGLAWGGSMPRNPILLAWRDNSNKVVISSRMASGHVMPEPWSGSEYTLFSSGTKSNGTHWQFTALCKGCASWTPSTGATRYLSPRGGNRLAMAYSPTRPSNPNSPSSTIPYHAVHSYWSHDFAEATNPDFQAAVQRLS